MSIVPYLIVSIAIMGPLLLPGFVLTMDMVFTPQLRMSDHVDNTFVLYTALHLLNTIVPADVLQKILLLVAFTASGFGMYRLLMYLKRADRWWSLAAHGGGIFYAFNPFVYDRLMAGQYGVLLGYAFLPWLARAVLLFLERLDMRSALKVAGWLIGISIVSIHSLGFALLIAGGLAWFKWPDIKDTARLWRYAGIIVSVFVVASAYWLLPALFGQGRIAESVQTFSGSQRQAFATADTNGETSLGAVLALQGFWQDTRALYVLPIDFTPQWGFVRLALWAVMGVGVWQAWRTRRREARLFIGLGVLSIVLALGVVNDIGAAVVPFFAGYREPQKFVAILALCYCYFMAWGMHTLFLRAAKWRKKAPYGIAVVLLMLIVGYTSPLLWGAQGQLRAAAYPADWQAVNQRLNSDTSDFRVLYLPWHLYMSYDFAGRIIASPAPSYFDKPFIVSDDPELDGVSPQFHNATKQQISQTLLPALAKGEPIAPLLNKHSIRYILVAKELDYRQYDSLGSQPGLVLVMQTQHFYLYQVR